MFFLRFSPSWVRLEDLFSLSRPFFLQSFFFEALSSKLYSSAVSTSSLGVAMGAQQSAFTLSVHLLLAAVHFICLSGHWDGTNSRTWTSAIEVCQDFSFFRFSSPKDLLWNAFCLEASEQRKKQSLCNLPCCCDTFTSLCNILSKTSFADLDISFSKQLRELRADNPPKMRALPWQCSRNQNVLGSSTAPVRADVVSCRHVSLVISGSAASGLYAPIAPSHALISMAAADTFLRLTSPSPQGVNKECSEMLWACVCMQILKLLVQSLLLLLNVFSFKAFFLQSFFFQSFLFEVSSSKNIEGY